MFARKRPPQPKGQGAAAAKQMGLFVGLDPEEMMDLDMDLGDPDLEAELAAITGNKAAAAGERPRHKGKSPLPMEDIARMADECMKDVDDDEDDGNLEDDEDLLAELQEVVGENEAEDVVTNSSPPPAIDESSSAETRNSLAVQAKQKEEKVSSAPPGSLQHTLEERIDMYKTAIQHAKTTGEMSKARRYDRGLKTLQTMVASLKKGRAVNEAEIPPPVATGVTSATTRPAVPQRRPPPVPLCPESMPSDQQEQSVPEIIILSNEEEKSSSSVPTLSSLPPPEEPADQPQTYATANEATKSILLERQIEYKMAALRAKKCGDMELAMLHLKTSKSFDAVIEAFEKGQAVDLSGLPPSLGQGEGSAPVKKALSERNIQAAKPAAADSAAAAPKDVLEALEQRRAKYVEALNQAKTSGDSRKARMYDRITKQYQSAIRAHKAGKAINFEELPVPPGFPPIPGQKGTGAEEGLVAAIKVVDKLASKDTAEIADEEEEEEGTHEEAAVPEKQKRPTLSVPIPDQSKKRSPPASPDRTATREGPTQPAPAAPKDVLEALEQRRAKYVEAFNQAKTNGDDRKARMYDRIVKQYQSAIRAHKAGKAINFEELPVPPGFPPIPGQKGTGAEQGLVAALIVVDKLASTDTSEIADKEDDGQEEESKPAEQPKKPSLHVPAADQGRKSSPLPSPGRAAARGLQTTEVQQLEFLEGRRKEYMKAALQAKQKKNMEQAKSFLRAAKSCEPLIEAARSGKPVDISKLPSPPGEEEDSFIIVHHSDLEISEKAEQLYTQLAMILKEQYEKCVTHSKQFTHLGNITETTKFERMAQDCKKSLEVLKLAQSRGLPPPKHHFEEKSFHTVRIFPELSSTDLVIDIVKGLNLPAPSGIQPNDLDAYIKFDFPYPSSDQPQKHKTAVMKNTNCPEYNQSFTLSINRNHRGFRRVVSSKSLKLELLHKGGFLRSDKPIGTAHVKLDKLQSQSEIREIIEVMDGRKPTGGRVEVKVRLREPLNGQDMQTSTERWLVIDQSQVIV